MTYQTLRILRDTIDGELNRIAVSDSPEELDKMYDFLKRNIEKYYKVNRDERIPDAWTGDAPTSGCQLKL